jgi:hypothetical protein
MGAFCGCGGNGEYTRTSYKGTCMYMACPRCTLKLCFGTHDPCSLLFAQTVITLTKLYGQCRHLFPLEIGTVSSYKKKKKHCIKL